MYLAMGMLAQLMTGAVFFQEYKDFHSGADALYFALSVMLTLTSVVAMARAHASYGDESGGSDSEGKDPSKEHVATENRGSRLPEIPSLSSRLLAEEVNETEGLEPGLCSPKGSQLLRLSTTGFGGAIEMLDAAR